MATLMQVVREDALPKSIRINDGPEFAHGALDRRAYLNGVELDAISPDKPTDNALVESFNGRFSEECPNESRFLPLEDARDKVENRRRYYNLEGPFSWVNVPHIEFIGGNIG